MKYILNEQGEPLACEDITKWANWFEGANRRVAVTMLDDFDKEGVNRGYLVSTVFLGLNHAHFKGPPILWETMVFKGSEDAGRGGRVGEGLWFDRCSGTREQAEAMHEDVCKKVKDRTRNSLSKAVHGV